MELTLTHDIISNLDEIVERMLSNHAAVMVGSGFSMNALKSSPEVKSFPSWADLGDAFYKKVNGKRDSQDGDRYLNALKLAEEVQAQFGRIVLDKILQQEIPDKKYNPSRLHIKLLQLPWNDVFTTNYDTLLERASQEVISRKYDVIVKNEDLVYSEKPRIIKLHGSFPSQRPFIITEEDYRVYPAMFAPFVNTVQQSLLENALCLIGFSGNDPNFLAWIGWIRDNLGKENSSKLYLIGVFGFSSAQRMLLEKRNIIILDFSECPELGRYANRHEAALEAFLDYLLEATRRKKEFDWLAGEKEFHVNYIKNADIKDIIRVWAETRNTYPGWWILPEDLRKRLWRRTDHTLLREVATLKSAKVSQSSLNRESYEGYEDLLYLYEYNWRQEKCLIPLCLDQVKIYEEVIGKYNPYPDRITMEGAYTPAVIKDSGKEPGEKWIDLQLALLRYYRENNDTKKLNETSDILNRLQEVLSPEQHAKFSYERCLNNLFGIRFNEIKDCLFEWKEDDMMPVWEAKRASIWAILGEVEIACEIIGKALAEVRKQLMLVPVTNNYTMVSQEASLMFLSAYYQQAINLKFRKNENVFNDSYKERSAEHKKYKCDPFQEKRIFEIELSNEYIPKSEKSVEHTFDIGHVVNHLFINYDDSALLTGLELLRYLEEAGIPVSVGNVSYSARIMTNVLHRISYVNPYLTMIYTILYGDKKNTKYIFSRKGISEMDYTDVDSLCTAFLQQLKLSENEIKIGDTFYTSNFGIRLAQILPEILSRLCVKCSVRIKANIADFIYGVYTGGYPGKYDKLNKLLERLIKTCNESDLAEIIRIFIKVPVNCDEELQDIIPDPFIYIENYYGNACLKSDIGLNQQLVQNLICSAGKEGLERENAIVRLIVLWKNHLLSEPQSVQFAEALWSRTEKMSGFPAETFIVNNSVYLELPVPAGYDLPERLKQYLIQGFEAVKNGNAAIIQEIQYALRSESGDGYLCKWSKEERLRLFNIALEYYDALRGGTPGEADGISGMDESCDRLKELAELMMDILLRQSVLSDIPEEKKQVLITAVKEMEKEGIPCCKLKLSCKNILGFTDSGYYDRIVRISSSNDLPLIIDCYEAIYYYLLLAKPDIEEGRRLAGLIAGQIVTRRKESLYTALEVMNKILVSVPEYIGEEHYLNIICGLEYLYEESQASRNDADFLVGIRSQAMGLAGRLYQNCIRDNKKIPSVIERWKLSGGSSAEFWEVRTAWTGDDVIDL